MLVPPSHCTNGIAMLRTWRNMRKRIHAWILYPKEKREDACAQLESYDLHRRRIGWWKLRDNHEDVDTKPWTIHMLGTKQSIHTSCFRVQSNDGRGVATCIGSKHGVGRVVEERTVATRNDQDEQRKHGENKHNDIQRERKKNTLPTVRHVPRR